MKRIANMAGVTMIFGAILVLAIPAQAFFEFNEHGDYQTDPRQLLVGRHWR
jgi:hypothetical protein